MLWTELNGEDIDGLRKTFVTMYTDTGRRHIQEISAQRGLSEVCCRANTCGPRGFHQRSNDLITNDEYENYRLHVEYRFAGDPGNCGVLVHASTPRALYSMFPKSIEVQMNHQHAGDFWCIVQDITVPDMVERRGPKDNWGITEGKARRIVNLTDGSENAVGQWNTMVIECVGDQVKAWVNGDLVNHGSDCTATKGQIALQAEGSEVEFRKLTLTPISELTGESP